MDTTREPHQHLEGVDLPFPVDDDIEEYARNRTDLFDHLIEVVGDADALWALDVEPLPDEPFDWSAVDARDRPFVGDVLAVSDRCCEELLDVEYRTIARRILARVAARDPRPLRRSKHPTRIVLLVLDAGGK